MTQLTGYRRSDGRMGIRNRIAVAYLVECAHHVAREIAWPNRAELFDSTIVVVVSVGLLGLFVALCDVLLRELMKLV